MDNQEGGIGMICPLKMIYPNPQPDFKCLKDACEWWCWGEQSCAVKAIMMTLIKLGENNDSLTT